MISKEIISIINEAEADLDDLDFTALFGESEGLDLFNDFVTEHRRNLVSFLSELQDDQRGKFIEHINDQFTIP